jgi:hypothetical protein
MVLSSYYTVAVSMPYATAFTLTALDLTTSNIPASNTSPVRSRTPFADRDVSNSTYSSVPGVDVSQIASVDSKSYAAGSGWLRVSAVSIGDSSFHFMMDPFDLAAYRECLDGCRDWVFAGVGLAATYSSESLLVSLRTNLGERVDTNESGKIRFRDAARILLVFQGEF